MIPALVLTAGLATRLRPLSLVRAKAALPVAGEPLICRILRGLKAGGVTEAVLNLHHLPDTLTAIVGDGGALGMRVRYSWEAPVLGSAGGPRRAAPILGASTFLIVNGDTLLTSIDLPGLLEHHRRSGALVTMAVTPNAEPDKYSGLATDASGAFTGVVRRGAAQPSQHFVGVQVAEAEAFASVPADVPYESVGALYPQLIAHRAGAVRTLTTGTGFYDIGTPLDYFDTSWAIADRESRDALAGERSHVGAGARIERSILWDDVEVGAGATVRECILTDGVVVPHGTVWHRVAIRRRDGELAPSESAVGDPPWRRCDDTLRGHAVSVTAPADVRTRVDRFLASTDLAARGASVVALTGDASDWRYFRVLIPNEPSQVLAVHTGAIDFEQLPFVNVAGLLAAMPVPVPRILGHSNELGIMALQDLGDVTLQAHLGAATPSEHAALYRQAVGLIDTLQRRGADLADPRYLPYGIAFDVEKLTWELNYFLKHFLEAYKGATFTETARAALAEEFASIVEELAAEPRVLCHRDYHSRNLMLHEGALHVIDFQDARLGPDTYDLVSLLRDSYVDFSDAQVDEMIAYFLALRGVRAGDAGAGDAGTRDAVQRFRARFDVMALQRNLKALGTFGFQAAARGNPVYIQYIPRTVNYVRANLERHARFARLRELLAAPLLDPR